MRFTIVSLRKLVNKESVSCFATNCLKPWGTLGPVPIGAVQHFRFQLPASRLLGR